jgi:hypothetical protein
VNAGDEHAKEQPVPVLVVTGDGVVLYATPWPELPQGTITWDDWLKARAWREQRSQLTPDEG